MGELEGEHDGGEGRAGHAAQRAGHADQGPHPGRSTRQDVTEHAADGCSHHEDGGEDATAGAAAESAGPDDQLHDEQQEEGAHTELTEQLGVDGVVADAEARGSIRPPMPMMRPPIIGHHIQCRWPFSFLKRSSQR